MSIATNYAENMLVDFIRGVALPFPESNLYIGLLSGFDSDESYAEFPFTSDYSRLVIGRTLEEWSGTQGVGSVLASTGTSHVTRTNVSIDWAIPGIDGVVTHFGIFDAATGGNLWWAVPLSSPLTVGPTDPVSFGAGEIAISVGLTGGLSNYASNMLIDHIFRGQAFTWPDMWVGYTITEPTNAAAGQEPLGGYARVLLESSLSALSPTQGGTTTDPSDGESGRTSNTADLVFPTPTGNQGDATHVIVMDAETVGNLLFHAPLRANGVETVFSINLGAEAPRFNAGALGITVR